MTTTIIQIREPMYNPDDRYIHGVVTKTNNNDNDNDSDSDGDSDSIKITWNTYSPSTLSQNDNDNDNDSDSDSDGDGMVYIDGSERKYSLNLGDCVTISIGKAPQLPLYHKLTTTNTNQ